MLRNFKWPITYLTTMLTALQFYFYLNIMGQDLKKGSYGRKFKTKIFIACERPGVYIEDLTRVIVSYEIY